MQSNGKLGSIVAGVIAIFLVLICLFYISFTVVGNHYEDKAEAYAHQAAGAQGTNSDTYRMAYKSYIDSISKEKVWLIIKSLYIRLSSPYWGIIICISTAIYT